jgi:hypothetical protein
MTVVVGSRVTGGYRITEALWDNPGRGRYRGSSVQEPLGPVLIAVTAPQRVPLATVTTELALELAGVTPLRTVGTVDVPLGTLHALVETEPAGRPLADWRGAGATRAGWLAVGVELARIAASAHDRGLALGGLRPELVYAELRDGRLAVTAVAPRAIGFFRTGGRVDGGNVPAFDAVFEPPAIAAGQAPSAASDVFTLGAGLGWLIAGRHPFGDDSWMQQLDGMSRRDGTWPAIDDPALRVLESCLLRDPARRPTAAQLAERLAATA